MSSPLIERLTAELGYALLGEDDVDAFAARHEHSVLFFTEDPGAFPESNDVAVILPELVAAAGGALVPGVVAREAERTLYKRYGFREWPTLVFLRRGNYLGAISRVQDWDVYRRRIDAILAGEPTAPPGRELPARLQAPAPLGCAARQHQEVRAR